LFYVHYNDLDRRLDRWVTASELKPFGEHMPAAVASPANEVKTATRRTRRDKRKFGSSDDVELHDPESVALEKEHEERTKVKNIYTIQIGAFLVDTWYWSPFPEKYRNEPKLYFCEFCLKYMKKLSTLETHKQECPYKHPPGNEIYRSKNLSVFEIDGSTQKVYCQCLCLLAKLFIDHKTLYYDVEPFLFYVLTEYDKNGYHVVGYFSKEKESQENYNVACILTFPQHQRKGYGKFLITTSYELSKIEGKLGSPEKPLSDLGKVSYRSYWSFTLIKLLEEKGPHLSIKDLSDLTCIKPDDVIDTLQHLGLLRYMKGQHIVCVTPKLIEQHSKQLDQRVSKHRLEFDPTKLLWTPSVWSKGKKAKTGSSSSSSSSA